MLLKIKQPQWLGVHKDLDATYHGHTAPINLLMVYSEASTFFFVH